MRFGCVLAVLMTLAAQDPKPPAVVSPEVLADGRVTVRLWAPKIALLPRLFPGRASS
jgi:hypothetical protein